jgi:hypothetical protein
MKNDSINRNRNFLKDSIRKEIDFSQTDQNRGIDAPLIQKEYSSDQKIISLPKKDEWKSIKDISLCSVFHKETKSTPI